MKIPETPSKMAHFTFLIKLLISNFHFHSKPGFCLRTTARILLPVSWTTPQPPNPPFLFFVDNVPNEHSADAALFQITLPDYGTFGATIAIFLFTVKAKRRTEWKWYGYRGLSYNTSLVITPPLRKNSAVTGIISFIFSRVCRSY